MRVSWKLLFLFAGIVWAVVLLRYKKSYRLANWMFLLGAILNAVAVLANGGVMPVDHHAVVGTVPMDDDHVWMTARSRLTFLADWIPPFGASLGDAFLFGQIPIRLIEWIVSVVKKRRAPIEPVVVTPQPEVQMTGNVLYIPYLRIDENGRAWTTPPEKVS